MRPWYERIWWDIVDWWNGVRNYEPGEVFPGATWGDEVPQKGLGVWQFTKLILLGYFGLAVYSEIKSPTRKTKKRRWKAGKYSVG